MSDKENIKYIIGIDEVGRGPIAGPVAVCAFLLPVTKYQLLIDKAKEELELPLRDSKKLSKKQREKWFEYFKRAKAEGFCSFAVSYVSPENIDKFGITKCIQKALNKSLKKVTTKIVPQDYITTLGNPNFSRFTPKGPYTDKNLDNPASLYDPASFFVYLDGGLKAPEEYVNQETIIKGDELHPVISMASIIAKVTRDKIMTDYELEFPGYGFDKHSGYGTKTHYEAIKKHGQTHIHRKSFIH